MFGGFHEGMGAGGWILMTVFWFGLLTVIVWAVARLVPRSGERGREPQRSPETPLEVLDRRLAGGEIDLDSYELLRAKLTSQAASGTG
jgi:putative membrane protein